MSPSKIETKQEDESDSKPNTVLLSFDQKGSHLIFDRKGIGLKYSVIKHYIDLNKDFKFKVFIYGVNMEVFTLNIEAQYKDKVINHGLEVSCYLLDIVELPPDPVNIGLSNLQLVQLIKNLPINEALHEMNLSPIMVVDSESLKNKLSDYLESTPEKQVSTKKQLDHLNMKQLIKSFLACTNSLLNITSFTQSCPLKYTKYDRLAETLGEALGISTKELDALPIFALLKKSESKVQRYAEVFIKYAKNFNSPVYNLNDIIEVLLGLSAESLVDLNCFRVYLREGSKTAEEYRQFMGKQSSTLLASINEPGGNIHQVATLLSLTCNHMKEFGLPISVSSKYDFIVKDLVPLVPTLQHNTKVTNSTIKKVPVLSKVTQYFREKSTKQGPSIS